MSADWTLIRLRHAAHHAFPFTALSTPRIVVHLCVCLHPMAPELQQSRKKQDSFSHGAPFLRGTREGGWWLKTRQNRDFTCGLTPKLVPGFWKMLSTYLGSELYKFICIIICSWKYCSLLTVCFHFMQWSNIFIKIITSKYVSIQISTLRILQGRRIKLQLQPMSGANNNFLRPLELITDNLKTHWPTSL